MGDSANQDQIVTTIRVGKPREVVFAFLANPRNLVAANRKGQIVEKSDGPLRAGSFAVLAFDQVRARVTYEVVERPHRMVVAVVMSGRLSHGMNARREFGLAEDGDGTSLEVRSSGSGGWISWGPLVRAAERSALGHLTRRIESA